MKIGLLLACVAGAFLLQPMAARAADTASSWKGWISDDHCGAKGAKAGHEACALKCMEKGSKLVLVNTGDGKIYKLDKQDVAKKHLGHEVTVQGKAKDDAIAVDTIAAAK
jgi:uncharacterized protein DUF5818